MKRKDFLRLASIGTGIATLSPSLLACRSDGNTDLVLPDNAFSRPLTFPEEIRATDKGGVAGCHFLRDAMLSFYSR